MTRPSVLHFAWVVALTFALTAEETLAETYVIDASHSSVDFSIRHLVGRTKGRFGDFSGTIGYDAAKPDSSSFSGTIQVKSIDTGNERRDGHLQSDDFFGAETYPTITFESTEAASTGENTLSVKGQADHARHHQRGHPAHRDPRHRHQSAEWKSADRPRNEFFPTLLRLRSQ